MSELWISNLGFMPVSPETYVDVVTAGGEEIRGLPAVDFRWGLDVPKAITCWRLHVETAESVASDNVNHQLHESVCGGRDGVGDRLGGSVGFGDDCQFFVEGCEMSKNGWVRNTGEIPVPPETVIDGITFCGGFKQKKAGECTWAIDGLTDILWWRVSPETSFDNVNHPAHYTSGEIECIDAIKAATSALQGEEAFCTGNALKYLWRWKAKGGHEDLRKAVWYIERMLKE